MIIVRLFEGLGNQLFEYAYARALQEQMKEEIYLDISHNNRGDMVNEQYDVKRMISIDKFNISLKLCTVKIKNDIYEVSITDEHSNKTVLYNDLLNYQSDENKQLFYLDEFVKPAEDSYLSGKFVNRLYFKGYEEIIRQELTIKKEPVISERLIKIMRNCNTVSLHIRLTDFCNYSGLICRQTYYDIAYKYISKYVDNPYYIIFTDDVKMAKEKYHFPDNIYWISEEKLTDYEELWLMTKCKHNIMAASTYSFWGAWLNNNVDKIVITPKKWAGRELCEDRWIMI